MAVKKLGSTKTTDSLLVTSANLASEVTGILGVANGGTGQSTFTNGQLLIGNTTGNTLAKATLTQGSNVVITNGAGSITLAALTAAENPNQIFASPASGGAAAPGFRLMVGADVPFGILNHTKLFIPYCEAEASSGQSISTATLTVISLQTELSDNDSMHSTSSNTSRITASTAGKYLITGTVPFSTVPNAMRVIARIYKNGTGSGTVIAAIDQQVASGPPAFNLSAVVELAIGDYVELAVYHDAGSSVSLYNDSVLKARMSAIRVA